MRYFAKKNDPVLRSYQKKIFSGLIKQLHSRFYKKWWSFREKNHFLRTPEYLGDMQTKSAKKPLTANNVYFFRLSSNNRNKRNICRRLGHLRNEVFGHEIKSMNVFISYHVAVWIKEEKRKTGRYQKTIHRTDGPAVVFSNGKVEWWREGVNITKEIQQVVSNHELDEDYRNWSFADWLIIRFAIF